MNVVNIGCLKHFLLQSDIEVYSLYIDTTESRISVSIHTENLDTGKVIEALNALVEKLKQKNNAHTHPQS